MNTMIAVILFCILIVLIWIGLLFKWFQDLLDFHLWNLVNQFENFRAEQRRY